MNPRERRLGTQDAAIERLLEQSSSSSSFGSSIIGFCDTSIDNALSRIEGALSVQYPNLTGSIAEKIQQLRESTYVPHNRGTLQIVDGDLVVKTPNGKNMYPNEILRSLYTSEPGLCTFEYAAALIFFPKKPSFGPPSRFPDRQTYPWFNQRFKKIAEAGGFQVDSAILQILSVAYTTQVAKNLGFDEARDLLKHIRLFGGVSPADKIDAYLGKIAQDISTIRRHQSFIALGMNAIDKIAERNNLSHDQIQVILDIAFARGRAFDKSDEFRAVLEPIIRLISEGKWTEAYEHRNFLLKYFSNSFPDWRSEGYQQESGVSPIETIKDLASGVLKGNIQLNPDQIPPEYQEFFEGILPRKLDSAKRRNDKEIHSSSVDLSMEFVRELSTQTKIKLIRGRILENDSLRGIFLRPGTPEGRFDSFLELIEEKGIEISYSRAQEEFAIFEVQFRNAQRKPYLVRTPEPTEIIRIEMDGARQVYLIRRGDSFGLTNVTADFGNLINSLIRAGVRQSSERPVLTLEEIANALKKAWETQAKEARPDFTLVDYLNALTRPDEKDQVLNDFIDQFRKEDTSNSH